MSLNKGLALARRHYDIPPMTTLVAFEAAARSGSFKAAAEELNVTPGAISHQIKALERELACRLFDRVHRGVILTDVGQTLFFVLRQSFNAMATVLEQIRKVAGDQPIVVSTTTSVSALWLTPRIVRFWREHPDIAINQTISDNGRARVGQADLSIVYGSVPPADGQSKVLFRDHLVPVAAPGLAARAATGAVAGLASLPLIHLQAEGQDWTDWRTWFAAFGYHGPITRGVTVNNYMIALQSAQDGVGVVLGWKHLVKPLLDNGSLVVLGDFALPAPGRFYILRGPGVVADGPAAMLEHWLLQDADPSHEENSP